MNLIIMEGKIFETPPMENTFYETIQIKCMLMLCGFISFIFNKIFEKIEAYSLKTQYQMVIKLAYKLQQSILLKITAQKNRKYKSLNVCN